MSHDVNTDIIIIIHKQQQLLPWQPITFMNCCCYTWQVSKKSLRLCNSNLWSVSCIIMTGKWMYCKPVIKSLVVFTLGPAYNEFGCNEQSAITNWCLCIKIIDSHVNEAANVLETCLFNQMTSWYHITTWYYDGHYFIKRTIAILPNYRLRRSPSCFFYPQDSKFQKRFCSM